MTGDLGTGTAQVHASAREVLDFWFGLTTAQHFGKDEVVDREIARRFGDLHTQIATTGAAAWRRGADTLLAAVIVLDQFSRNMFRARARAYAFDGLALELTELAIERGWEAEMAPERRVFLLMPLMHGESATTQARSVERFRALGIAENLRFAEEHRDVIATYGRFPSRNAALGRVNTPAEEEYLADSEAGW